MSPRFPIDIARGLCSPPSGLTSTLSDFHSLRRVCACGLMYVRR